VSEAALDTPSPAQTPAAGAGHPRIRPPRAATKVIVPAKRRVKLRDLFRGWSVLRVIAMRDFKSKYKQSALGPIWLAVQPLGMLAAFTVVFNGVTKVDTNGVPYALFGLTGICVWSYFQMSVSLGSQAIVASSTFIKRVELPRFVLPMSSMLTTLPVLGATLVLTLASVYITGASLPLRALLLPVAVAWLILLSLGVVLVLSSLAARFRDILGMLPFVLQAGMFISPVAYPADQASGVSDVLLTANPLTGLIDFWRWTLLSGASLDVLAVAIAAGLTTALVGIGWYVFTRLEVTFADVV
jgi:lipopolysaccharide transport system permease protein